METEIGDRNNNELNHVLQHIKFHPEYYSHFISTENFLLRGDGPLPYDFIHYIAIMASARHKCAYLVNRHKNEFISQNGDASWLQGLKSIPKKLNDLSEINQILAHRPWLITKSHIEKLAKGKDNWSVGEVVHAVVLLAHFHCLCSFVFGSRIFEGSDNINGKQSVNCFQASEDGVEELMEKMKNLVNQRIESSHEELLQTFVKVEKQTMELVTGNDASVECEADVLKFLSDTDFTYDDFRKCSDDSTSSESIFRIQDCSWNDHAYSLLNRFYDDVGTLLDEKFKVAYDLTYYTMGHKDHVDTTIFRRAVWNYIHCIFGIRHDDYNYDEINELLELNLQAYIKAVCCFPDRICATEYENVMKEFRHSEKIHVNLMIFEARLQAELLYALSAIMQYMT